MHKSQPKQNFVNLNKNHLNQYFFANKEKVYLHPWNETLGFWKRRSRSRSFVHHLIFMSCRNV